MDQNVRQKNNRRIDHTGWEPPAYVPSPGLEIVIDIEACTGCNFCVLSCPTDCLELDEHVNLAYVTRADACILCYSCERVCPPDCIDLKLETGDGRSAGPPDSGAG